MTEKTSAELQHDAEIARARVSDTAESIRNKMTPGQLIDEFSGMFTAGDGGSLMSTLKSQVGANPLPVALVGVGLMWLMAGQRPPQATGFQESWPKPKSRTGSDLHGEQGYESSDNFAGGISDAVSRVSDKAAGIIGDAAEGVRAGVASGTRSVSDSAAQYGASAADEAGKITAAATDLLRQEPLVLAALGLAFGTAVGAMLPHTDFEDQQLGQASDNIRDKASELLNKGVDGAKDVATQAYQTLKDEADKKGFSADPASIVEQVTDVVKSAASKTEETFRDKIQEVADKPTRPARK
ncbi:hypothetical protein [Mesorhizobium sp. 43Arga]